MFIDTFPFNGASTVCNALWVGLPVLTKIGESFTGRAASSILNALELNELIANTKEENLNFGNAGCVPQSQNFKLHINKLKPNCEIDIIEPGNDNSVSKIISSLKKYDGVILTGSTLRIEDKSDEVKKHI